MPQTLPNGRIVLAFVLGINTSTRKPQWQARVDGVLHVPHYCGTMPTKDGESWECKRLDQIGSSCRRGAGVVVVWLVCRYQRKEGREAHRQQLANA